MELWFLLRGNSKNCRPGSSHQGRCTGQKQEQPLVPPPSDKQCPWYDTGDTPLSLRCSGRKPLHLLPRVRPTFCIPLYLPHVQEQAHIPLMRVHGFNRVVSGYSKGQILGQLILIGFHYPPWGPTITTNLTHLAFLQCTRSHPQHRHSRCLLDPHSSPHSWWVRQMIHNPGKTRLEK